VDWKGTIRALISNQAGEDVQGASTLTQQYVKNYLINVVYRDQTGQEGEDPQKKMERQRAQEQSITRKLREARLAIQLEQNMSKDDILTGYLNVVEFTNEIFGVGAASQAYFATTPDKLTVPQSALLAGMVNNPSLYNPWKRPEQTLKRRNLVIDTMVETSRLSEEDAEKAKKEPLGVRAEGEPLKPAANCVGAGPEYGFFCQYVEEYLTEVGFSRDQLYTGGYTIKTTFDAAATQIAKRAVEAQVPKDTEGVNNSMAIVRPGAERHEVVALVSNRDYGLNTAAGQTTLGYPYDVMNKFGAGSNFKIFTAAAFLEKGGGIMNTIQTPPTHASNVFAGGAKSCPRTDRSGDQDTRKYCLSNSSENGPTSMTLQQALATSPNTGFVILEERTGMDAVVDMASRLGLRKTMATNGSGATPDPNSDNPVNRVSQSEFFRSTPNSPGNASFTLGPAPVSVLEMANVGATIMSRGVWCPPTPISEVLDRNGKKMDVREQPCEQAVDPALADALAEGMSKDDTGSGTAANAARTFGWNRPMIGKTGTTQTHQSAAFLGATPQLSAAVHTFGDSPQPRGICLDPVRLCGSGNIFGGRIPARTWFDTMKQIHEGAEVLPLPVANDRYRNGGSDTQVPDVVGDSEADATAALQGAGYKVSVVQRNNAQEKGTVVGQSPRGNALAGETITIYVSTGYVPPPQTSAPPATETPPPSGGGGGGEPPPGGGTGPGGGGRGGG
jgi:membrane peptidoglycan carboxypeptidase